LMNLAHAYIVLSNPDTRGTAYEGIASRVVTSWEELRSALVSDDDLSFYGEADAAVLSYARVIHGAHKHWREEIELARLQFSARERNLNKSLTLKVATRLIQGLVKLLLAMGFGFILALLLGHEMKSHESINLMASLTALGFGVVSVAFSTLHSNRQWSSAASQLATCLGMAEEQLERASIDAFDLHWFQFCEAYRAYTGEDYTTEPSFISIMRGKLLKRERWNKQRVLHLTSQTRIVLELLKRRWKFSNLSSRIFARGGNLWKTVKTPP
jgi:hypothetical protein